MSKEGIAGTEASPSPPDRPSPEIVLDLSRLLSRVLHPTPTGIDRVEMAYARELMARIPERLSFAAVNPWGGYGRLPADAVKTFLDETQRLWNGNKRTSAISLRIAAARKLWVLRPRAIPRLARGQSRIYLQASPHHLDREALVAHILKRERARLVCLVHDLIPIEYPEYARPGGAALHRRRMDTLGRHAAALIANSQATADSLTAYLAPAGRVPPVAVAHLGTLMALAPHVSARAIEDTPYFVCVGTIEARKNHLMLLNIWRRLAERTMPGAVMPKLVLAGRRGWEIENVVDMLDRCPGLAGYIVETGRISDPEVQDLLRGACALLLPSFAEGYGMPVAEALELGVPVICSDLPALREVGQDVPEYIDPLDGSGWEAAILDYMISGSPARKKQLERARRWTAPSWCGHLDIVIGACSAAAAQPL